MNAFVCKLALLDPNSETALIPDSVEGFLRHGTAWALADCVFYRAFVDEASGVDQDSFAMAVAHTEGKTVVLDFAFETKPPFNPLRSARRLASTSTSTLTAPGSS